VTLSPLSAEAQNILIAVAAVALLLPAAALLVSGFLHASEQRCFVLRAGIATTLAAMLSVPLLVEMRPTLWTLSLKPPSAEREPRRTVPAPPPHAPETPDHLSAHLSTGVGVGEAGASFSPETDAPSAEALRVPASPQPSRVHPVLLLALPSMGLFMWFCIGAAAAWRIRSRCVSVSDPGSLEVLEQVCAAAHTPRPPLVQHPALRSPVLFGPVRSAIGLPCAFGERYGASGLRVAISHEIAHLIRRDLYWSAAGRLLCAAAWFSPTAHRMVRSMEQSAEEACDAGAVAMGCRPVEIAGLLLQLAESRHTGAAAVLSLSPKRSALAKRVRRILTRGAMPGKVGLMLKIAIAAGAIVCTVGVSAVTPRLLQDPTLPPAAAKPAAPKSSTPVLDISRPEEPAPPAEKPTNTPGEKQARRSDDRKQGAAEDELKRSLQQAVADLTRTAVEFARVAKAKGESRLTPQQDRILEEKSRLVEAAAKRFAERMERRAEEIASRAQEYARRAQSVEQLQKQAEEAAKRAEKDADSRALEVRTRYKLHLDEASALKAADIAKLQADAAAAAETAARAAADSLKELKDLAPILQDAVNRRTQTLRRGADVTHKVPILSDLPILGDLIKTDPAQKSRSEEHAEEVEKARRLLQEKQPKLEELQKRLETLKTRRAGESVELRAELEALRRLTAERDAEMLRRMSELRGQPRELPSRPRAPRGRQFERTPSPDLDTANELRQLRAQIRQLEEENRRLKDDFRRKNPTLPDPS
jgi:beta-lactamase regulating signal transducer with metallopeptidase domain